MKIVAICGGGGKTTIKAKFPNKFIDIDEFVWDNHNKKYHAFILDSIDRKDYETLGKIYKEIYLNSYDYFKSLDKVILVHHPKNAEWLKSKCLIQLKPSKELFNKNISCRSSALQEVSLNSWDNLENATIYNSHKELEEILLKI